MLRVLTKTACYIEGVWHAANTEIEILEKHFAQEVHHLLDEDGNIVEPTPAPEPLTMTPTAKLLVPANENTPTESPDVPVRSSNYTIAKATLDEPDTAGAKAATDEKSEHKVAPLPEDVPPERYDDGHGVVHDEPAKPEAHE